MQEVVSLLGVDPHPVTVGALVDAEVFPLAADEVVAAGGALHQMGSPFGGEALVADGFLLLAEEVGFAAGEVLGFVTVETHAMWHILPSLLSSPDHTHEGRSVSHHPPDREAAEKGEEQGGEGAD